MIGWIVKGLGWMADPCEARNGICNLSGWWVLGGGMVDGEGELRIEQCVRWGHLEQ